MQDKELLEKIADIQHVAWMSWSKNLATELKEIKQKLNESQDPISAFKQIDDRLERWQINWKSYSELDEKTKELDRIWAKKVLKIINEKQG